MKLFKSPRKQPLLLVLSDLHLGSGKFFPNGQLNILEDFEEDERFYEFVEHYTSGEFEQAPIHLVLNGDILNLIQIDIHGVFTHVITEERSIDALNKIYEGHKKFFEALKIFANSPNKEVSYIIGNHDASMAWKGVQKRFSEIIDYEIFYGMNRNINGVHIEHGHRFEVVNTVPPLDYFIEGPNGQEVLNLPWGSLFCILALPKLKKERPYIDRVRPMSQYIKWCLFHDFAFFWKMLKTTLHYFIRTHIDPHIRPSRNLKTTFNILRQITIFPKYEKQAKRILRNANVHTVVMGHTHLVEWRRFPEGKLYFNCGTWNPIPSMDAGLHPHDTNLTYVTLVLDEESKTVQNASINVWKGKWRPFFEEISLTR